MEGLKKDRPRTFSVYIKQDKKGAFKDDERNVFLRTLFNSFYLFSEKANLVLENRYSPSDVGVFFGLPKVSRRGASVSNIKNKSLKEVFDSHGRQLVVERGYLKRDKYYSIGWNGINGNADFKNEDMPSDRFDKLKIKRKKISKGNPNGHVLFCGQMPFDANVQELNTEGHSYVDWCRDTVLEIKKHTKKDIVFRLHPLLQDRFRDEFLEKLSDICIISGKTIQEDFEKAWVVVALNSNSLVEATVRGLPIFALDKGSVAYDIANKDLKNIDNPIFFKESVVSQWFYNLAYTQWTIQEFEKGLPLEHLGLKRRVKEENKTTSDFKILKPSKTKGRAFKDVKVLFTNETKSRYSSNKWKSQVRGFERTSFIASEGRRWKCDFFCKPWELDQYIGESSVSKFLIDDSIRHYGIENIIHKIIPGVRKILTKEAELIIIFKDFQLLAQKNLLTVDRGCRSVNTAPSIRDAAESAIAFLNEVNADMSRVGKSTYPNLIPPKGYKDFPIRPVASVSYKLLVPILNLNGFNLVDSEIAGEDVFLKFINKN